VPWARPNSGFSLRMEALLVTLCKTMAVSQVAQLPGVSDGRVWRTLDHYVDQAHAQEDFSTVTSAGLDETASRRGHNDQRPGHATRRPVIAGVLVPRGVRAGTDAGRTRATEGHGRRLIFCTRNRTDPILGFANNGDAPVSLERIGKLGHTPGFSPFAGIEHTLGIEIVKQADVIVSTLRGSLVETSRDDGQEVLLSVCLINVMVEGTPDTPVADAKQLSDLRDRHRLTEGDQ